MDHGLQLIDIHSNNDLKDLAMTHSCIEKLNVLTSLHFQSNWFYILIRPVALNMEITIP